MSETEPKERQYRPQKGVRFYGVITLGAIIGPILGMLPVAAGLLIWGVRIESRLSSEASRLDARIDHQMTISAMNTKAIETQLSDSKSRGERIETTVQEMAAGLREAVAEFRATRRTLGFPDAPERPKR